MPRNFIINATLRVGDIDVSIDRRVVSRELSSIFREAQTRAISEAEPIDLVKSMGVSDPKNIASLTRGLQRNLREAFKGIEIPRLQDLSRQIQEATSTPSKGLTNELETAKLQVDDLIKRFQILVKQGDFDRAFGVTAEQTFGKANRQLRELVNTSQELGKALETASDPRKIQKNADDAAKHIFQLQEDLIKVAENSAEGRLLAEEASSKKREKILEAQKTRQRKRDDEELKRIQERDKLKEKSAQKFTKDKLAEIAKERQAEQDAIRNNFERQRHEQRLNELISKRVELIRLAEESKQLLDPSFQARPEDVVRQQVASEATILPGERNTEQLTRLRGEITKNRTELTEFEKQIKAVNKAQLDNVSVTNIHSNSVKGFGEQAGLAIRRYSAYLLPTTGLFAVIGAIRASIREFTDFEAQQTRFRQILGLTQNQVEELGETFRRISVETGIALSEITQGARIFAQAGFGRGARGLSELAEAAEAITKAQLAPTFETIEDTADGMIAIMNQFRLGLTDVAGALDVVNQLSKDFAVESSDFFDAARRGGSTFAVLNGEFEEFAGFLALVRSQTRQTASQLGTFFKTGGLRLFRADSVEVLRELDEGLLFTETITERIFGIADALQELSGLEQARFAERLVGVRQTERFLGLITAITERGDKMRESLARAGGSIENDVQVKLDDITVSLQRATRALQSFVISILENEQLRRIAQLFGNIAEGIGKLAESASGVIGPALLGGGALALLTKIRPFFQGVQFRALGRDRALLEGAQRRQLMLPRTRLMQQQLAALGRLERAVISNTQAVTGNTSAQTRALGLRSELTGRHGRTPFFVASGQPTERDIARRASRIERVREGRFIQAQGLRRFTPSGGTVSIGLLLGALGLDQLSNRSSNEDEVSGFGVASGALTGALIGQIFGPIGIAVGALGGTFLSLHSQTNQLREAKQREALASQETAKALLRLGEAADHSLDLFGSTALIEAGIDVPQLLPRDLERNFLDILFPSGSTINPGAPLEAFHVGAQEQILDQFIKTLSSLGDVFDIQDERLIEKLEPGFSSQLPEEARDEILKFNNSIIHNLRELARVTGQSFDPKEGQRIATVAMSKFRENISEVAQSLSRDLLRTPEEFLPTLIGELSRLTGSDPVKVSELIDVLGITTEDFVKVSEAVRSFRSDVEESSNALNFFISIVNTTTEAFKKVIEAQRTYVEDTTTSASILESISAGTFTPQIRELRPSDFMDFETLQGALVRANIDVFDVATGVELAEFFKRQQLADAMTDELEQAFREAGSKASLSDIIQVFERLGERSAEIEVTAQGVQRAIEGEDIDQATGDLINQDLQLLEKIFGEASSIFRAFDEFGINPADIARTIQSGNDLNKAIAEITGALALQEQIMERANSVIEFRNDLTAQEIQLQTLRNQRQKDAIDTLNGFNQELLDLADQRVDLRASFLGTEDVVRRRRAVRAVRSVAPGISDIDGLDFLNDAMRAMSIIGTDAGTLAAESEEFINAISSAFGLSREEIIGEDGLRTVNEFSTNLINAFQQGKNQLEILDKNLNNALSGAISGASTLTDIFKSNLQIVGQIGRDAATREAGEVFAEQEVFRRFRDALLRTGLNFSNITIDQALLDPNFADAFRRIVQDFTPDELQQILGRLSQEGLRFSATLDPNLAGAITSVIASGVENVFAQEIFEGFGLELIDPMDQIIREVNEANQRVKYLSDVLANLRDFQTQIAVTELELAEEGLENFREISDEVLGKYADQFRIGEESINKLSAAFSSIPETIDVGGDVNVTVSLVGANELSRAIERGVVVRVHNQIIAQIAEAFADIDPAIGQRFRLMEE